MPALSPQDVDFVTEARTVVRVEQDVQAKSIPAGAKSAPHARHSNRRGTRRKWSRAPSAIDRVT